MHPKQHR